MSQIDWISFEQGSTADLLKDIITIFYTPLAQVYRAASIADSLGDLQNFINDLIKTVEQVEEGELGQNQCRSFSTLLSYLLGQAAKKMCTIQYKPS